MKLKYSKKDVAIFFKLLPYFVPLGLTEITEFRMIWYAYLLVIIILNSLKMPRIWRHNRNKEIYKLAAVLGMYVLMQGISTFSYGGNWMFSLFKAVYLVSLCLFSQDCIDRDIKIFLAMVDRILLFSIVVSVVCNTLGMFNPCGSYVSTYISLPVWMTIRIIEHIEENKRNNFEIYLMGILTVFSTILRSVIDAGTGESNYEWTFFMEVIVICVACFAKDFVRFARRIVNSTTLFLTVIFLNLAIVVFQVFSQLGIVQFILVNIMHKDVTFTGRTGIWGMAMGIIEKKPLLGYGEGLVGYTGSSYWENFIRVNGSHNQFLQIMLFGGAFSLAFYILAHFIVWRNIRGYGSRITQFIAIGLFAVLLELTFVYRQILMCTPLYILMVVAINNRKLISGV